MEGLPGHHMICRACLRIVENRTQSFGFIEDANGNLKDMIMCCIPEMDIYVSSNPIMCFPCIQLLVTVYNFKTRCLNTETIIRSYIQRNSLGEYNHVNLNSVVFELIRLNNYFKDAEHRRIEDERSRIEGNPQYNNRIPYGMPQGNFRAPQGHPEQHENIPRYHGMRPDVHVPRNHVMMENMLRHEAMMEHERMLEAQRRMSVRHEGLDAMGHHIEEYHNDIQRQELEAQNVERNQSIAEHLNGQDTDCNMVEQFEECDNETSNINSGDKCENPVQTRLEKSGEDTDKAARDNVNGDGRSEDDKKQELAVENRPRLIIKISKNKITIPRSNNEDSNEKENEEMDVETNRIEMPQPEPAPLEIHPPLDENAQQLYECHGCTFVTTHAEYYDTHRKICPNELNEKKCPHCPHVTNRQYALNKHINTMHTRRTWYTCDLCEYRSTDSSCLRRHKRNIHPEKVGQELLACQLCAYRCTTEYHLRKHVLKHDDNLNLQCEFCSYSTRDRSNFRKHIFIHNPKPQDCEFCDYKCVSPYQMKLHLKRLHNGVGMEDVDCRSEVSLSKVVQDISEAIKEVKGSVGHQTE